MTPSSTMGVASRPRVVPSSLLHTRPSFETVSYRVISLLRRWLVGTHQGAVSHKHLDYYLDELTFRFNRRKSKSRGKLFFRLAQQARAGGPVPFDLHGHLTPKKT